MDSNSGLASAVLTPINETKGRGLRECPAENAQCKAALELHATFTRLASFALAKGRSDDKTVDSLLARVQDHLNKPYAATECREVVDFSQRKWAWGRQACLPEDKYSRSRLVVPSLAFDSYTAKRTITHPRLRKAAWISELLEPTVATMAMNPPSEVRDEDLRFVQAYFISVDNLLRIWSVDPISEEIGAVNEPWAAQYYFRVFLQEKALDLYESPPTSTRVDMGSSRRAVHRSTSTRRSTPIKQRLGAS